jgi:NitT/TauT family transport system substrate-binding protein
MIQRSLQWLRRAAAMVAALGLVALAPAVQAQAQPVKVRVSTIPIIDTAPLQVAIAKGFFAAEGLDVDTTPTAGGASGLPALAAGQVQITFSNIISIVLGAKQGLGFQVIAAGSNTGETPPDLAGIVAKAGSTIKTGKDLEGKRLAVNTRNNIIWLYARAWVQATGGNPDAVTYLEVPFPQMLDAVRGDRVDAAFIVEPFLSAGLKSQGMTLVGWPYNTVQKNVPVAQYAATRSFIQENPQVIERWVRAYNKGVDWANQNAGTDELHKIIAGYTRLTPEQIAAIKLVPYQKTVSPADIDTVVALMRKHGMTEGAFDSKALLYKTATEGVR